jgi:peptide/nickel transport system substrate-binding protein
METLSRRDFLRLSALTAAGVVVTACTQATSTEAPTEATPKSETKPQETPAPSGTSGQQAPALVDQVAAGTLPALEERIPTSPRVVPVTEETGQYGGTWRRVWLGPSDGMNVTRETREGPIHYSPDCSDIVANVAEGWEVAADATKITFKLRQGTRWSDGESFTADDMLFWWDDVIMNDDLNPSKPSWMKVSGELGQVTKVDDYTVEFSFPKSYGLAELYLAGENGMSTTEAPKHYMSKFHASYVDKAELDKMVSDAQFETWDQLYGDKNSWVNNGVEKPALWPWTPTTKADATRFLIERNPYYSKTDPEGNQLPYVDRIAFDLVKSTDLITVKVTAGEIDMMLRHMQLANLPIYQENAAKGGYRILHWPSTVGNDHVFMFNQNYNEDPTVAQFLQSVDFRRALSLAINRAEIVDTAGMGIGEIRQSYLVPTSRGYDEATSKLYTDYDPEQASKMLDELGLTDKDGDGFRLRPDGSGDPLTIIISVSGSEPGKTNELVKGYWEAVGVKTIVLVEERSLHYTNISANKQHVATWGNEEWVYPLFLVYPWWVMPYGNISRIAPMSGQWFQTDGKEGIEPTGDLRKVIDEYNAAGAAATDDERFQHAMEMVRLDIENLWTVGTYRIPWGPCICKENFRNVPEELLHGTVMNSPKHGNPETWFFKQ